jgi:flagellar basal-body rod protein FlgB
MKKSFPGALTIDSSHWCSLPIMDPTQIGLFDLAERRLAWTDQRQTVLAKNIANISTPSYQPQDVEPFARILSGVASLEPVRTHPNDMSGTNPGPFRSALAERPKAIAPDGNAVSLDEELIKVADTETTQTLVTNIYKKYFSLFNTALGRSS